MENYMAMEQSTKFGIVDYVIFASLLLVCVIIGLYHAFWGKDKSKSNEEEYLMGGRNMNVVPVSASLVATLISGISLLGLPTEFYVYGSGYAFYFIGFIICGFITAFVYLPVLHELKLSSIYEYLGLRFNTKVQMLGSFAYMFCILVWLPIVIYTPALAFNQVTGVNIHIVSPAVCLVCMFYTCIGGLKAVVWTDLCQIWIMILSMLVVVIKGTIDVGGLSVVLQRSYDGGRIDTPSFEFDMTERHSFWSLTIGACVFWTQVCSTSQDMTQRYLTLPTYKKAQQAVLLFQIGVIFVISTCMYAGLVAYATYYNCDPLTTKVVKAKDQILPLLVMRVLGQYYGMPGLFISGIFSAALSSLSTGLNAMSAIVLQDFVKPFYKDLSSTTTNWIMKSVVVVFALTCLLLVFVVEKLGTVVQLAFSLGGATAGSVLGMFTCGMLIPWVNSKGALTGGITGMIFTSFIVTGAQQAIASGKLKFPVKPVSIDGCDYFFNSTVSEEPEIIDDYVFPLYKVSYLWYTCLGTFVTIIVAVCVSYCTGFTKIEELEPVLVSPIIRKYLPKRKKCIEEEEIAMLKKNKILIEMESVQ